MVPLVTCIVKWLVVSPFPFSAHVPISHGFRDATSIQLHCSLQWQFSGNGIFPFEDDMGQL
jgi:hypothetical protein